MRKNPEKTSPRKLVQTGDRTWARRVTSAHATTWPTAVYTIQIKIYYPAGDCTPDLLNQRQKCYHLSQRGELSRQMLTLQEQDEEDFLVVR